LQVLHVRNWIYPQQVARTLHRLAQHFCQHQRLLPYNTVLILASGQCYQVSDVFKPHSRTEQTTLDAVQIDSASYQQYVASWTYTE
jgi:hypothetical protein